MSKLKPFPYYGAKSSHLNFILKHLPYTERYIEPFGGSGAVLLNRDPSPVETYNDLDGDVVNFFRVLREQPDELVRQLELTPYSREEFTGSLEETANLSEVERARRLFVRLTQGRNSRRGRGYSADWSYSVGTSRRGMSNQVSAAKGCYEQLDRVAERLSRVQIENQDAIGLIETHDHEDALFYCDPPYAPDSRSRTRGNEYAHDMGEEDHRELAQTLRQCEGDVAISAYSSDLVQELFGDWTIRTAAGKTLLSSEFGSVKSEVLIMNYDPDDVVPHPNREQATLTEAVE